MKIGKIICSALPCLVVALLMADEAAAHDPIFGLGPHTLFKGGVEVHVGSFLDKSSRERSSDTELQLKYGITSDWVAGLGIPYVRNSGWSETESGRGATSFSTKYRFWRKDMPGAQAATAVLGKVILDDASSGQHGQTQRDGNDYLAGLTYGYEGRKWYRWASVRHRFNNDTASGAERSDMTLLDLVIGIRPTPTEYLQPDWVWMLELNGEITENVTNLQGNNRFQIGGEQWFISPGLMFTYRNFAVKIGLQVPIYDDVRADQQTADYRAQIEFEWHL